jgi:hypothetical protein
MTRDAVRDCSPLLCVGSPDWRLGRGAVLTFFNGSIPVAIAPFRESYETRTLVEYAAKFISPQKKFYKLF